MSVQMPLPALGALMEMCHTCTEHGCESVMATNEAEARHMQALAEIGLVEQPDPDHNSWRPTPEAMELAENIEGALYEHDLTLSVPDPEAA